MSNKDKKVIDIINQELKMKIPEWKKNQLKMKMKIIIKKVQINNNQIQNQKVGC